MACVRPIFGDVDVLSGPLRDPRGTLLEYQTIRRQTDATWSMVENEGGRAIHVGNRFGFENPTQRVALARDMNR